LAIYGGAHVSRRAVAFALYTLPKNFKTEATDGRVFRHFTPPSETTLVAREHALTLSLFLSSFRKHRELWRRRSDWCWCECSYSRLVFCAYYIRRNQTRTSSSSSRSVVSRCALIVRVKRTTRIKRPDESQHHPQSTRRRKKNDQSPIRPRALRTMPGDKKHSRVRQQRHDRPVTANRTDTRPGGNNRQKSLQGTETLFTKSASARDAGTVFGEPGETERLESNGESESTEKEENAFESGGATGTRGRVGATATTPTTRRIGIGKKRRRKNDDGEEDKE